MNVLHHQQVRKRLEPYPSPHFWLRVLDAAVYVAGIVGPLATIPQVIKIYGTQNAAGVSALSWGLYALLDIPWVIYAIAHKERPLMICYILWFLFNGLVALGAMLYGGGI